jgi:hypothetical protein
MEVGMGGSDDSLLAKERNLDTTHLFNIEGKFIVEKIGADQESDDIILKSDRVGYENGQLAEIV